MIALKKQCAEIRELNRGLFGMAQAKKHRNDVAAFLGDLIAVPLINFQMA